MDYFSTATLGVIILMVMTTVVLIWQTLTISRHEGPRGTFVEMETQRVTSAVRAFLWQIFKGPVFALVLLAIACFYFQAQYETAVRDFELQMKKRENSLRCKELNHASALRSMKFRLHLAHATSQSHPLGLTVLPGEILLQQVDGYDESGNIIWAKSAYLYRVESEEKQLTVYLVDLSTVEGKEKFSPSRPFRFDQTPSPFGAKPGRRIDVNGSVTTDVFAIHAEVIEYDGRPALNFLLRYKIPIYDGVLTEGSYKSLFSPSPH